MKRSMNLAVAAMVACLSIFASSCSQEEDNDVVKQNNTQENLLETALNTDAVKGFQTAIHGNLILEGAELEVIPGESGSNIAAIVTVPIQGKVENQSKGLYIHYDFATKKFDHQVIAVTYGDEFVSKVRNAKTSFGNMREADQSDLAASFNATYEFISLDGEVNGRLKYQNNELVEDFETTLRLSWWCMFKCMVGKTSWRERISCGFGVISCATGNWLSCATRIYSCAKNGPRYYRECSPGC